MGDHRQALGTKLRGLQRQKSITFDSGITFPLAPKREGLADPNLRFVNTIPNP